MLCLSTESKRVVTRAYAIVEMCERANVTLVPYTTLLMYVDRYATLVDDVGCIAHSLMFDTMRTLRSADSYKFQTVVNAVEFLVTRSASLATWYDAVETELYNPVNDSATWSRVLGHGDNVRHWCNRAYIHAPYTLDDVRDWADFTTPDCIVARCEAVVTCLGKAFKSYAFDSTLINAMYSVVKDDANAAAAYRLLRNHLHDLEYVSDLCASFSTRGYILTDNVVDLLALE